MPKQITLEEILQAYKDTFKNSQFVSHAKIRGFITTYFTQFAEGLRLDRRGGNPEMETNQDYGFNKAKATLDNTINKALGKE